jgi:cathepsin D
VLGIGTPPQWFTVLCDTGSPVTWVPSATWCDTRRGCDGHRGFNASASSTVVADNLTVTVQYGDGTQVAGGFVLDTVSAGGVAVSRQALALVAASSSTPSTGVFDGLLGLGLSTLVPPGLVANAAAQGLLAAPLFSVWLNPDELQPDNGGELLLGGVDETQAVGPRVWANLTSTNMGSWPIALEGVWVGGDALALGAPASAGGGGGDNGTLVACGPGGPGCIVAIDTGTSLVLGPPPAIAALYAALNAAVLQARGRSSARFWRAGPNDCTAVAALMPAVSFGVAGTRLTLSPWQYLRRDARGALTCQAGFAAVSLPQSTPGAPSWLLGDVFLGAYTAVFDARYGGAVGLAAAVPPPRITTRQAFLLRLLLSRALVLLVAAALSYVLLVEAMGVWGVRRQRRRAAATEAAKVADTPQLHYGTVAAA